MDYGMVAESFETSAPWDRVVSVVNNTKSRLTKECIGIKDPLSISIYYQ